MTAAGSSIPQGRCYHHPQREAVARCPVCSRFYCRECITEHDDRVICSSCLREIAGAGPARSKGRRLSWVLPVLQGICSLLVAWLVFYSVGRLLLRIPSSFHEGTLWKSEASSD